MESSEPSRARVARHRASQRARGLRPVTLWLPDPNDPAYRARMAEECRRLSRLTPGEDAMASAFEARIADTSEWR